jgi:hypothetical protein
MPAKMNHIAVVRIFRAEDDWWPVVRVWSLASDYLGQFG